MYSASQISKIIQKIISKVRRELELAQESDTARLEYSTEYSDIIYGPTPHKTTGMGDTSSLLAKIKNDPTRYTRLTVATANGALKLSITSFKNCLSKTRYFEAQI